MVRRVELKVIFTFILYKPANFALTVLFTTHSMSFLFMLFWTIGLIFLPLSYLHLLHVLLFPPVSIRSYSTVQLNLFPRTVAYFGACNLQHPLVSLVFALIWSLSSRFFPCFELNPLFSPTLSCKPDSSPSSFAWYIQCGQTRANTKWYCTRGMSRDRMSSKGVIRCLKMSSVVTQMLSSNKNALFNSLCCLWIHKWLKLFLVQNI